MGLALMMVVECQHGLDRVLFTRRMECDHAREGIERPDNTAAELDDQERWLRLYRVGLDTLGEDPRIAEQLKGRAWPLDDHTLILVAYLPDQSC